ncbi:hypothetical protein DFH06DRAFT_1123758 [Mycena polygramma]|nr:hypothetical protein DFH06DRAFT_1123758 [Mycena polygramma]
MADIVLDDAERWERCQRSGVEYTMGVRELEVRACVGCNRQRESGRGWASWLVLCWTMELARGRPTVRTVTVKGGVDIRRPGDRWTANKILEKLEGLGPGNPRPTGGGQLRLREGKWGEDGGRGRKTSTWQDRRLVMLCPGSASDSSE